MKKTQKFCSNQTLVSCDEFTLNLIQVVAKILSITLGSITITFEKRSLVTEKTSTTITYYYYSMRFFLETPI